MRVSREQLLRQLECVESGLTPSPTVQQSNCFVFQSGQVMTYNDVGGIACRSPSLLIKMTGAVEAQSLLNILRKMKEEEIEIEAVNSTLIISGKRKKIELKIEKELALPIDSVETPSSWKSLNPDFSEAINVVKQCVAQDSSEFYRTCVHVHPNWIEACNYIQLCRWRINTGAKIPFLVKQDAIKSIISLGMTEIAEGDIWVHFRNPDGLILSCRRYLEDYPDLSKALIIKGSRIMLPQKLSEIAGRAEILSKENIDNENVLIELKSGSLILTGEGLYGRYTEEITKFQYEGRPRSFLIHPKILSDLVKRQSEWIISDDRLKMKTQSYVYLVCLIKPDEG